MQYHFCQIFQSEPCIHRVDPYANFLYSLCSWLLEKLSQSDARLGLFARCDRVFEIIGNEIDGKGTGFLEELCRRGGDCGRLSVSAGMGWRRREVG